MKRAFVSRWLVVYFVLYALPLPFDRLPPARPVEMAYERTMQQIVPWVGKELLGVDATVRGLTRSGDQLYYYVQLLLFLVVSGLIAVALSLGAGAWRRYERLYPWLLMYLRLKLATSMFFYGAFKVFPRQFPPLSLTRLVESYGQSSPMGLLWNFMGASPAYEAFVGTLEMAGGFLLLFPALSSAGALLCCATLLNVVVTNLCYDVPVKLHAIHLFALAALLAAPDGRRLIDVLLLNRPTTPLATPRLFRRHALERTALAVQLIFGTYVAALYLHRAHATVASREARPHRTPFYGIWFVDDFSPAVAAETRWHRVIFEKPGELTVQLLNGELLEFRLGLDVAAKRLVLRRRNDPTWTSELTLVASDPERLVLTGSMDGRTVQVAMHRIDETKLPLLSRRFRWVSERAFDR